MIVRGRFVEKTLQALEGGLGISVTGADLQGCLEFLHGVAGFSDPGEDGSEIIVYKFRSMTTQDNGSVVRQATKNDARITPFGGFLRRTSLDELPQFINVLQGRMSIVGPRPHAVAHNEQYRELIKAYMVRHKVKPGITGWAQVNGHRGETDTIDKMRIRVEYDLEYLRNWSLGLDLRIIVSTIRVLFFDRHAY